MKDVLGLSANISYFDVLITLYPYLVKLNDLLELNTQLGTNFSACTIIYQVLRRHEGNGIDIKVHQDWNQGGRYNLDLISQKQTNFVIAVDKYLDDICSFDQPNCLTA